MSKHLGGRERWTHGFQLLMFIPVILRLLRLLVFNLFGLGEKIPPLLQVIAWWELVIRHDSKDDRRESV